MLETLRHIVQEVNAARGLEEALDIIVRRVQDAMQTQVCSVYLQDGNNDRLIFRATQGLNQALVDEASLPVGEGLVGLVAARGEPVNLEEAEKQNKDNKSVRQRILDLETKNEKSKTSGCFSGIMNSRTGAIEAEDQETQAALAPSSNSLGDIVA